MGHFIHDIIKFIVDFVFLGVVVKIIVGHWLAERIVKYGGEFLTKTERNAAIRLHFIEKLQGIKHTQSISTCTEGKCRIF
jgi:uncharacterized membrane protein